MTDVRNGKQNESKANVFEVGRLVVLLLRTEKLEKGVSF